MRPTTLFRFRNWGKKHLLIFYVDPDHANQNTAFTDHLEKNHILSDNIHSFGIVNLKDAPMLPNSIVRAMVRKKINKPAPISTPIQITFCVTAGTWVTSIINLR